MFIRDLLKEKDAEAKVEVVGPRASLTEAARSLCADRIGAMIVADGAERLVGIVSERDLVRAIFEHGGVVSGISVGDVMTRTVVTCTPGNSVAEILDLMMAYRIRHIPVVEGGGVIGVVSIHELARACELLQVQADTDPLTGLPNRRHFLDRLKQEFDRCHRYGHPLSLAMIDVDHFKLINDTHGHEAGDEVLKAIARVVVRELRSMDVVGRLGGEEFAAIFPETDLRGAATVCDRLLHVLRAETVEIVGATIGFTASIGLTVANTTMRDPASVLKKADEMMYAAKLGGRDCIRADTPDEPKPDSERVVVGTP